MSEHETAWTPGEWEVRDGTPEGGGQVWEITSPHAPDVNCNEVASSWENRATAELIALAPTMAAAILEWDNCNCGETNDCPCYTNLGDLSELLRAINTKGTP